MNPIVGVDVAKGESQTQAFTSKGEPFGKSEKVSHSLQGLDRFDQVLSQLKEKTGETPSHLRSNRKLSPRSDEVFRTRGIAGHSGQPITGEEV